MVDYQIRSMLRVSAEILIHPQAWTAGDLQRLLPGLHPWIVPNQALELCYNTSVSPCADSAKHVTSLPLRAP